MKALSSEMKRIIEVAIELKQTGYSPASSGERIAAAFVLNRQDFLPQGYTMVNAWDQLNATWQASVREIRYQHMYLIDQD